MSDLYEFVESVGWYLKSNIGICSSSSHAKRLVESTEEFEQLLQRSIVEVADRALSLTEHEHDPEYGWAGQHALFAYMIRIAKADPMLARDVCLIIYERLKKLDTSPGMWPGFYHDELTKNPPKFTPEVLTDQESVRIAEIADEYRAAVQRLKAAELNVWCCDLMKEFVRAKVISRTTDNYFQIGTIGIANCPWCGHRLTSG